MPLLADQVVARHADVVKEERPLLLGLVQGGVLHLLREPRRVGVDDEEREPGPLVCHGARRGRAGHEEQCCACSTPEMKYFWPRMR